MIDLGLSGLLARFEKTFGTQITNCLLGLIGLTVAIVCLGLIATYLIPTFLFLIDDQLGAKYNYYSGAIGFLIFSVIGVVGTVGTISSMIERQYEVRAARQMHDDTAALHSECENMRRELRSDLEDVKRILSTASESIRALQNDDSLAPVEKIILARWQSALEENTPNLNADTPLAQSMKT